MPANRTIGAPLVQLDEVVSTNDEVKAQALRGADEGLVVVARHQTGGRGRRGRLWESPPDLGLYFSALLRPSWPAAEAPWLGVLAALAVWQAVRGLGVEAARIKWPNDIMAGGRKLAGVLVEPRIAGDHVQFAVVGIGLNLAHADADWPEALRGHAISLRQLGVEVDQEVAVFALCASLTDCYARAREGGVQALTESWREATGAETLPDLG